MKRQIRNMIDYIILPIKYGGGYAWLSCLLRLLAGVLPLVEIKIIAEFVDSARILFEKGGEIRPVYIAAICLGAIIGFQWLTGKLLTFTDAKMIIEIREKFCPCLLEKCARLKYAYIEDAEVQDKILRVTKEPEGELYGGFNELLVLVSMVIRIVGIVAIIASKLWWCGVFVLLLHLPIVYFARKNGESAYQADKDFALHMRRYEYLNKILVEKDSAMERNLFQYAPYVHKLWDDEYKAACTKYIKAFFRYFFATRFYCILSVVFSLIMVLFLWSPVMSGQMSIGLFIAVVSNLLTVVTGMVQQLSQDIREISRKQAYMDDLQDFLGMEEEDADILECPKQPFPDFHTLEFKKVSFRYPGTENYILKDISFRLEKGQHYAFVGENAAGKTTITKLILGLYDNYEGEILINGKERKQYSVLDMKGLCAVVCQDYAQYHISVRDNVMIGALAQPKEQCKGKVEYVLRELGLWEEIEKMPEREATVLGKFTADDRELSMGQWQRLAIARAMMKEAPIRILDEPSAALDPVSESRIYAEYDKLNQGKTTIFITHRLGSIKLADTIFVFEGGRLLAQGGYSSLMQTCDSFKKMYEAQRSWYE